MTNDNVHFYANVTVVYENEKSSAAANLPRGEHLPKALLDLQKY